MANVPDPLDEVKATLKELAATDRRLQERQEALAQSVELLVGLHRDNETRIAQLMDTMNRLGNIIISHEQRSTTSKAASPRSARTSPPLP